MTPAVPPTEGLTAEQAELSRREHGSNQLTQKKRRSFFHQFLESFGDPIIKILLAALAVNVIFLFRHFDWFESAGIAVAIFLATFVSTLSEYGSESAFARLQEDAQKVQCRVRRAGRVIALPIADIVVGDVVLLQAGERVPADGVVIEAGESTAYGNYIVVAHDYGIESFYGHCNSLVAVEGQQVKQGETIAKVGATGWATGNHLHLELRKDGVVLSPAEYVAFHV